MYSRATHLVTEYVYTFDNFYGLISALGFELFCCICDTPLLFLFSSWPKMQIPRVEMPSTQTVTVNYVLELHRLKMRAQDSLHNWYNKKLIWLLEINYEPEERRDFPHSTIAHWSRFCKTHSQRDLTTGMCCPSWSATPMLVSTLCSQQRERSRHVKMGIVTIDREPAIKKN